MRVSIIAAFVASVDALSVLDTVRKESQFSTLAEIIAGTGGGIPNPDIEARFGSNSGRDVTFFAPTNDAFKRISKPFLQQLAVPQNYPLLLSLLNAHFTAGRTNASVAIKGPVGLTSFEGHTITLAYGENGTRVNNQYYAAHLAPRSITADNGIIHPIDHVLDPYVTIFGLATRSPSGKPTVLDTSPRQEAKTMTDLVSTEPQLSTWTALITDVLYGIMKRLGDRRGPEGGACTTPHPFAVFPNNAAFELLPANYTKVLRAPYSFALASHLLAWGISVPTCATFDDIMNEVRTKGAFRIYSHRADINITVTETAKGSGELLVNNARVVMANRCAGNGCLWIVDRLLDPVYGMF